MPDSHIDSDPLPPSSSSSSEHTSTMGIVFGIFLVITILLVGANTRTRRTMTSFLNFLGVSMKRSPRVIKELKRKGFHFSGLIIPFIYLVGMQTQLLTWFSSSLLMIFVTTVYFVVECIRLMFPSINKSFAQHFGGLLREKERNNFTGSFFYLVGSTVSIVFFRYLIYSYLLYFLNQFYCLCSNFFFLLALP